MRRIDMLIGVVLAAAVAFSFLGLAVYERPLGPQPFDVSWGTLDADVEPQGESRTGPGSMEIPIPINQDNLTSVTLNVEIAANGNRLQPVNVEVEVIPINVTGQTQAITFQAGPAGSASVSFAFAIQATPSVAEVQANSTADGQDIVARQNTTETGRGTWSVSVTISGGNPQGLAAEEYSATVTGSYSYYEATVTPRLPDIQR